MLSLLVSCSGVDQLSSAWRGGVLCQGLGKRQLTFLDKEFQSQMQLLASRVCVRLTRMQCDCTGGTDLNNSPEGASSNGSPTTEAQGLLNWRDGYCLVGWGRFRVQLPGRRALRMGGLFVAQSRMARLVGRTLA